VVPHREGFLHHYWHRPSKLTKHNLLNLNVLFFYFCLCFYGILSEGTQEIFNPFLGSHVYIFQTLLTSMHVFLSICPFSDSFVDIRCYRL
jgi:hypothetical protein